MTQDMRISIGGICVGLWVEDPVEADRIRERYGPFLSADPACLVLEVNVLQKDWPEPTGRSWPLSTNRNGSCLRIESYCEETTVDFATGKGRLAKDPRISGQNSLRVIFAWLCVSQGCLLVHSSGVIRDGRGYLFFGKSGAGKSSVARLSRGLTVLSDDLVMVWRANGAFHAQGVPFRGEVEEFPMINAHAPLAGVFRLVKDGRNYLEPASPARMAASLLASVPFVVNDRVAGQMAAENCAQLLGATRHGHLHFRPDGGFWEVIGEPASVTAVFKE